MWGPGKVKRPLAARLNLVSGLNTRWGPRPVEGILQQSRTVSDYSNNKQRLLHLAGELQLGRLGGCYCVQKGEVSLVNRHFVQTSPPPTAGTNQWNILWQ